MAKKIFISYANKHIPFANKVKADLEKYGYEVWIDKAALRHAVIWTQELTEAIIKNDFVLLLWSAEAKLSENVYKEIITARALLKPIIPILIEGEKSFPSLPLEIAFLQGIIHDKYEDSFNELLNRLRDEDLEKTLYPIATKNLFIPQNRNQYFVGRQAELVKLFVDLCGFLGMKARNNPCAISGLAGIGKTEIAIEFAYRFSILFPKGVYWIDADKEDLSSEFIKLAPYLRLQQLAEESKHEFAGRILNHLRNLPESLLIIDGLSSFKAFREWCPTGGQACSVMITTRLMLQGGRIQLLQLKELDEKSALQLLTSRRPDILQRKEEIDAATKVCKTIGNFPLALELFASHLASEPTLSAQKFLNKLDKVPPLARQPLTEGIIYTLIEERQTLFSLFDLIYEKLSREQIDPYFFLMSWFAADATVKYELIENVFGNPDSCSWAVSQLRNISLVSLDLTKRLILHPLIISFARELQDDQKKRRYQKKFVEIMTNFISAHNEVKDIDVVLPEVSHVEYAIKTASDREFVPELKILYSNYARYLGYRCEFNQQLEYLEKCLELYEKDGSANHLQIAALSVDIGRVFRMKGDFGNAKARFQNALTLYEQNFGPDHAEVANSLNELGNIFYELGDFDEALRYYQRAFAINQKYYREEAPQLTSISQAIARVHFQTGALDQAQEEFEKTLNLKQRHYALSFKDHPDVALSYLDISDFYFKRADYRNALKNLQLAAHILRKTIGKGHIEMAKVYERLGRISIERARYEKALSYFNKSLAINRKHFPEIHPAIANLYIQLSHVHRRKGEFDKALRQINESLRLIKKIYGESHPLVADALEVLIKIYYHQCKFDDAKPVLDQALQIREKAFEEKHPLVGNTLHDFGSYHLRKGEYDLAISYFQRALEISRTVFGEHHPEYFERLINLANGYYQKNDYEKARDELNDAKALIHKVYGDSSNPLAARMWLGFSEVHRRFGHFDKAMDAVNESLRMKKEIYGESHPSVADALEVLVKIYYHQCKFDEAKTVLDQTLKIREKAYGEKHPLVGNTLHDFGSYHLRRGEYDLAIGYFQRALGISRGVFGEEHPEYIERSINLANGYYQKNEYDKALNQLEETKGFIQKVYGESANPLAARMWLVFSEVHRRFGHFDKAMDAIKESLRMKKEIYGESHPSVADALEVLVKIYYHQCKFDEAKIVLDQTLKIREKAYSEKHPLVGNTLHDFGSYHLRRGEYDLAIRYFQRALWINQSIFGDSHPDTIDRQVTLASALRQSGDNDKALELLKRAEEISDQLFKNTKHPLIARAFLELSHVYRKRGNFKEADRNIAKSIRMKEELYGISHPSLAESLQAKAKLQIQYHQYSLAEDTLRKSLRMRIETYGKKHPEVANTLNELGCLLTAQEKYKQALDNHIEAYEIKQAYYGDSHPELGKILMDMGIAHRNLGKHDSKFDNAMACLESAFNVDNKFLRPDHPYLAKIIMEMGITLGLMKNYQLAIEKLETSLEIYEKIKTQDIREWAENMENLAIIYIETGIPDTALNYLKNTFRKKKDLYVENHPELARTLFLEGKAYHLKDKYSEARQKFEDAMKICRETSAIGSSLCLAIQEELKKLSKHGLTGAR